MVTYFFLSNLALQASLMEKIDFLTAELDQAKTIIVKQTKKLRKLKRHKTATLKELNKRTEEIYTMRCKIKKLKKKQFCYQNVCDLPSKMNFFTGVLKDVFETAFTNISKQEKAVPITKLISVKDHLFLVFVKLRLGLTNRDLAYRFGITESSASKIFRTWLPLLANEVGDFIIWPEKAALRKNMPRCFRKKYRNCVAVIDCTEIFIQRPLNLSARAETWSNYKNHNTIKYLVSCSPSGGVNFMSDGWGGRVSDKQITLQSGFLDLLENGDVVLADRGFQLGDEFAKCGAILKTPAFTKGKRQMSQEDVDKSREIANVRIHIERVIGRLRKFNILNTTIPTVQVDLLDMIIVSIAGLVNLNVSVIPK